MAPWTDADRSEQGRATNEGASNMGAVMRLINRIVSALAKRKVQRDEGNPGSR
jgi:hypothetical protein